MTRLAIIIPALDEEAEIGPTLTALAPGLEPDDEVVVVDGGSADRTVERARTGGARVLTGPRGRAAQMNLGARSSSGDGLVFLHADTRLGPAHLAAIRRALADPEVVGGSFPIRLQAAGFGYRLVERTANLRTRLDRTPYGDQSLFVRRRAFEQAGGFPRVELMEDVLLGRRLRKIGRLVFPAGPPVLTSARRYGADGLIRRIARNWATRLLWEMGLPPRLLSRIYLGRSARPTVVRRG